MKRNDHLKLHFVNVNHGDAILIEFPDIMLPGPPVSYRARFGVVDFGAYAQADRSVFTDYLKTLIAVRSDPVLPLDYTIEFACATHPHSDHYGGLRAFLDEFTHDSDEARNRLRTFWDCGFETTQTKYIAQLDRLRDHRFVRFIRVVAGNEFQFGDTRILVLAPSLNLRNLFDTYGVGINDASVVLRIRHKKSCVILGADAQLRSWAKIVEEFPRHKGIALNSAALPLAQRSESTSQLRCDLLKMSHHGSKHGTLLECLELLKPNRLVIAAADDPWYQANVPGWVGKLPHPLVTQMVASLPLAQPPHNTGLHGHAIVTYGGAATPTDFKTFVGQPGTGTFNADLEAAWQ